MTPSRRGAANGIKHRLVSFVPLFSTISFYLRTRGIPDERCRRFLVDTASGYNQTLSVSEAVSTS